MLYAVYRIDKATKEQHLLQEFNDRNEAIEYARNQFDLWDRDLREHNRLVVRQYSRDGTFKDVRWHYRVYEEG